MATYHILYWQEIPSLVEARDENESHKIQLSQKYQALIDQAAMVRKFAGSDSYLEQWNKGKAETRSGSAKDVARQVAAELESRFEQFREKVVNKPN